MPDGHCASDNASPHHSPPRGVTDKGRYMMKTWMKVVPAIVALGLLASVTSASAGNRHGHAYYNDYGYSSGYGYDSDYSGRYNTPYYQQSDEIRELRRAFPSTNWPPSDRY